MSTFFHSAAMSLLSRTLQALLSKYLSEVDVEGIALPSFTDSGWGVRLSSVKLRDGTKLMDLPGRPRRRKRKRNSTTPTTNETAATTQNNVNQQTNHNSEESLETEGNLQVETNKVETYDGIDSTHHYEKKSHVTKGESIIVEEEGTKMIMNNELQTVDTEMETDDTDTISTDPPKKRGWIASWWYGPDEPPVIEEDEEDDDDGDPCGNEDEKRFQKDIQSTQRGDIGDIADNSGVRNENGFEIKRVQESVSEQVGSPEQITLADETTIDPLLGKHPFPIETTNSIVDDKGEDNIEHEPDGEESKGDTDENDCSDDEYPMILRLGQGCTIGTLDVRLVGTTIHVLIEDADLTIEAVRWKQSTSNNNDEKKPNTTTKKPIPEPKTTGDRILAENAIARILSIIPNLFLRDIRIRVVLRDDVVSEQENTDENDNDGGIHVSDFNYDSNDTVIDMAIELLSVTDGSDFLLNFGAMEDDDPMSSEEDSVAGGANGPVSVMSSVSDNANEFLTRRIRTGRGPEGGFILKMYNASQNPHCIRSSMMQQSWARDSWDISTNFVLMRCSGLDVNARVFLGTRKEIAISKHGYDPEDEYYDDFAVDAMLFGGVDYIAPGPQPPLPPIPKPQLSGLSVEKNWVVPGATSYMTDLNGIQSCGLPSNFHRIARGFFPRHCDKQHLPCEYCHQCWTKDCGPSQPHMKDNATPLAGLTLHISMRDPLEINLDRNTLDTLGGMLDLFKKSGDEIKSSSEDEMRISPDDESGDQSISNHDDSIPPQSIKTAASSTPLADDSTRRGRFRMAPSRNSMDESGRSTTSSNTPKAFNEYDYRTSFPAYMKPENVQILGMYISEINFRIHVMQPNGEPEYGRCYCYWDVLAKAVTIDQQKLTASERPFQDLRFDAGLFKATEFKGVDKSQIISLGVPQRTIDLDEMTIETFMTADKSHKRSPWPSTAAAMLDVPPPVESLVYEERGRHGFQIRYIVVHDPTSNTDRIRKDANLRLGVAVVEIPYSIKKSIMDVLAEARSTFFGPTKEAKLETQEVSPEIKTIDSIMRYKVTAEGGRVDLIPLIGAKFPLTTFVGELSPKAGFSIASVMEQFCVEFGKAAPPRILDQGLSLQQLADLPETVRLRILLFLKDLKPLEIALGLPESSNSFFRCRAVNKGIVKMSKQAARRSSYDSDRFTALTRRQKLMAKLCVLDDDTLEDLLDLHDRNSWPLE